MKIIWRDDVRLEPTTDQEGTRYLIPVAPDSPLPRWLQVRIENRRNGVRYRWTDERLKGFVARQEKRKQERALASKEAREGLPVHSPLMRELRHQP